MAGRTVDAVLPSLGRGSGIAGWKTLQNAVWGPFSRELTQGCYAS